MRGASEAERRRPLREYPVDPRVAFLLGAALLCSGVLMVALTSQLSWRFDDWDVLLYRDGWGPDSLLDPQYEHIVFARNVVYKALLAAFGMESQVPFSLIAIGASLVVAVLLFVYLRRRVGDWLALILTTVLLFLGVAYEDLLWPVQIVHFGSIACGLGMLLALEREDRFGDRLACLLLVGSMAFFSLWLPFAAGAAVDIALRRDAWRKRIYIVAVPALLYALWWLGWGHAADTSISLRDIGTIPLFALDALAAGVGSLLGLVANSESELLARGSLDWGRPLLPLALLAAAWRIHQLGRVPRWLLVVAAIGFSNWILGGLAQQGARPPEASRYQYPSAIFILLIVGELLRGVRIGRPALIAVAVVAMASVLGNLTALFDAHGARKEEGERLRAQLGAIEIARDTAPPVFDFEAEATESINFSQTLPWKRYRPADTAPTGDPTIAEFSIDAGEYLDAVERYGTTGYSPEEIVASTPQLQELADKMLAASLGLELVPTQPAATGTGPPPSLVGPPEALTRSNFGCLFLDASSSRPPLLDLPPGGALIDSASDGEFQVRLRRFATTTLPIDLGTLPARTAAVVDIPADRATQPWKLSLEGTGEVAVCGRRGQP